MFVLCFAPLVVRRGFSLIYINAKPDKCHGLNVAQCVTKYYFYFIKQTQKHRAMTTQTNTYMIIDSMGRYTGVYYYASNINAALKEFKADKANYSKYYHGKLIRCYNGGVRG